MGWQHRRAAARFTGPRLVSFTLAAPLTRLEALNCFSSAGALELQRIDRRIELRFDAPLPPGPLRINCPQPAEGGRWRWFGMQFVVTEDAAR